MKREVDQIYEHHHSVCCPGHDKFPKETYSSRRSKKARSRDKKKEHKFVRTLVKRLLHRGEL